MGQCRLKSLSRRARQCPSSVTARRVLPADLSRDGQRRVRVGVVDLTHREEYDSPRLGISQRVSDASRLRASEDARMAGAARYRTTLLPPRHHGPAWAEGEVNGGEHAGP